MWLTAEQALARLGSKPQSLYASVSRGRIRARSDPKDNRRSLYDAEDVERLARRTRGRRSNAAVAAETISWGEPVLATALTTIVDGRLYYRGQSAVELADAQTFEKVAGLLWGGTLEPGIDAANGPLEPPLLLFARLAGQAAPSAGRPLAALRRDAALLFESLLCSVTGQDAGPAHERLALHWAQPAAAEPLRRALVLLADHELNASTFAARVAVSTGASLAAGALAAYATLSGPLHGGAASQVAILAEDIGPLVPDNAERELRDWLGEGRGIPGFGHRLYPDGDVRAKALLGTFEIPAGYRTLAAAAERVAGELANIDFALAAMAQALSLPSDAPHTIFAIARSVGWLAHMLEQATTGSLIRPRARYEGPDLRAQ